MKTLYAVLADIHGNWTALQQVERDARRIARKENVDLRFVCLGDVIDYGPQPNKCMEWVYKHCSIIVKGNHERAMNPSCNLIYSDISCEFWPVTLWTCRTLEQKYQTEIQAWPSQQEIGEHFFLFHGTLKWGQDGYIHDGFSATENLKMLPQGFHYGLFGHTHVQGYFVEGFEEATVYLTGSDSSPTHGWEAAPLEEWIRPPGRRARTLLNPGSVGQPRYPKLFYGSGIRRDNRACYMLLNMNGGGSKHVQFQFRRVSYAVNETVQELRKIRWPVETKTSHGSDILRGGSPPPSDPLAQKLREVKERPEMLHELVERQLIPALVQSD